MVGGGEILLYFYWSTAYFIPLRVSRLFISSLLDGAPVHGASASHAAVERMEGFVWEYFVSRFRMCLSLHVPVLFSGGDCAWYGDLFDGLIQGSRLLMLRFDWLPFSVPYRSCAWLGEVWNLSIRPVVSTGLSCFTISLSQPYALYGRGSAGRRASWLSSSQSHMNNFVHRTLCFGVGCLWRARIVLFTRFIWNFSFCAYR
jgi:hypothetical protein